MKQMKSEDTHIIFSFFVKCTDKHLYHNAAAEKHTLCQFK